MRAKYKITVETGYGAEYKFSDSDLDVLVNYFTNVLVNKRTGKGFPFSIYDMVAKKEVYRKAGN